MNISGLHPSYIILITTLDTLARTPYRNARPLLGIWTSWVNGFYQLHEHMEKVENMHNVTQNNENHRNAKSYNVTITVATGSTPGFYLHARG
jgi:hypothetical protein